MAGNVVDINITIPVGVKIAFDVMGSGNAEIGHFFEFPEQVCEVVLTERDVGVQVADHLETQVLGTLVAGVESLYFPCKVTLLTLGKPDQLEPFSTWSILLISGNSKR